MAQDGGRVLYPPGRRAVIHFGKFAIYRQPNYMAVIGRKQWCIRKPNGRIPRGGGCVHGRILIRRDKETNTRHKTGIDGKEAATYGPPSIK